MEKTLQANLGGSEGVGPRYVYEFGQRLARARELLDISQSELANQTNWRQDSWSRVEGGYIKSVPLEAFARLCEMAVARGVSLDWLILGIGDEHQRIGGVQDAIADPRIIRRLAESLLDAMENSPDRGGIARRLGPDATSGLCMIGPEDLPANWQSQYVPVVGRMAAGDAIVNEEAESAPPGWANEYVEFDNAPVGAIGVRVVGDSMEPDYHSGDIAIIDTRQRADSGVCCVLVADLHGGRNARLKRIRKSRDKVRIESLNPKYDPEEIPMRYLIAAYPIYRLLRS